MILRETGLNEQRAIVCTDVTAMEWNIHTYAIENVLFRKNLLDTLFIFMYVGEIHVCFKYHFIKYYTWFNLSYMINYIFLNTMRKSITLVLYHR